MRDYTSERSYDLNIIIALPFQRPVESEPDSEGGAAEDAALNRLLAGTSGGVAGTSGGGSRLFNGDTLDADLVAAAAHRPQADRRRLPVAVRPDAQRHDGAFPEPRRRRRRPAAGPGPRDVEDAARPA